MNFPVRSGMWCAGSTDLIGIFTHKAKKLALAFQAPTCRVGVCGSRGRITSPQFS